MQSHVDTWNVLTDLQGAIISSGISSSDLQGAFLSSGISSSELEGAFLSPGISRQILMALFCHLEFPHQTLRVLFCYLEFPHQTVRALFCHHEFPHLSSLLFRARFFVCVLLLSPGTCSWNFQVRPCLTEFPHQSSRAPFCYQGSIRSTWTPRWILRSPFCHQAMSGNVLFKTTYFSPTSASQTKVN